MQPCSWKKEARSERKEGKTAGKEVRSQRGEWGRREIAEQRKNKKGTQAGAERGIG